MSLSHLVRSTRWWRSLVPSALMALLLGAGSISAQTLVDISNTPLYGGRQPHPNVVVSTSVEFPTVGAAYLNVRYAPTSVYIGYFDPTKCYAFYLTYGGYFGVIPGASGIANANHECSNAFSGNFMNWATMSAIDEFRYAMTGGNRVVEAGPNGGTIIQRATLPDGSINGVPSFYNYTSNFPGNYIDARYGTAGFIQVGHTADYYTSSLPTAVLPNAVLLPTNSISFASCGTYIYFVTTFNNNDTCNIALNTPPSSLYLFNAFPVRVSVCDATEGPVRTDLCLQYPGGLYKPVGQIQVNAATMRFAAFGYLMDRDTSTYTVQCDNAGWNLCRYGGVLRAPITYVGPTKYDANQVPSLNSRAEINADGSLIADPEYADPQGNALSAGGLYSGVINYINKFGSGTNVLSIAHPAALGGVYKRYDPGTEMFYEAVRYYQNLQPTPLATQGLPPLLTDLNTVKDYFPVTTTWTDPIQSICAANYIINLSDANMWNDTYVPGYNGTPAPGTGRPSSRPVDASGLDAVAWTHNVGVLESTTPSIATNDVRPNLAGLETRYFNVGQQGSNFAAGIAYWANVNDIRSDLNGKQTIKTISFDVGEATAGYAIQDRQLYLMGKYGGFNNTIDRTTDTFPNPFYALDPANPSNPAIRSNTEWADSNVMPVNYILASDPSKLVNGIRAAFQTIGTQTGNLSGAALTSANLTFGAAGAYVATFNPSKWSGSVLFESLSVDSNGNLVVSNAPIWDAGALLTARCGTVASGSTVCVDTSTAVTKRTIFTTTTLSGTRTAVPFSLAGITPDATYLAALSLNPATGIPDLLAGSRINYLRGYRADEGSLLAFRTRDSVMGDIINSGPVYEGAPTANIPDADYQAFYLANNTRPPTVYVGSNDGMLHAIDASVGSETFAYVPGFSAPDLAALTNPGYVHKTYVDTVPKIQEVKLNGTWKSVLVGANGNGVQGIFGLDVTQPTSFSAASVLFEFSDADDADFGSVTAAPEIAKLWVSGPATAPVYRYFAVVTGYNKTRTTVNGRTDTHVSTDTLNKGTLFLIALDHTLGTSWTLNTDYYKFNFPASNPALANGLGPVTLLPSKNGDQTTAYMYFGDLQGNLWKLNTSTGSPSTWTPVLGTVASPLPIFVAQDNSGNRQPITARVELAGGPFGSTLVYFGTGKYLGVSDLTLPGTIQSEYSLLDVNPSVLINRSSDLVARTGTVSGAVVTITGAAFTYSGPSAKKGWYFDFPSSTSQGERSVTKPAIRTGLLTFTSLTLSNDVCLPGNGYVYQVDALSGLPFSSSTNGTTGGYASTVGIPGPPRVVDLQLTSGQNQATGEVINKKTQTTLVSGTAGTISNPGGNVQTKAPPTQEINWREITNYNDRLGN